MKRKTRAALIEALETRRMLTYTVTGTPGNDVFLVQPGSAYTITLNGAQVSTAGDINVFLNGLGGNDTFSLSSVPWGSITVRGGIGNDTVEVGTGNLSQQLLGQVYIEEFAGEGNDSFIAHDQADTAQNGGYVRIRDNLLTSSVASAGAHYDDNVEVKTLFCSNAADTVYVESPALGMTINLGAGNDTVRYGSLTQHDLPDFMKPATLNGGSGFDNVIFDDAGAPLSEQRDYFIDTTRFENQALTGVEDAELLTRASGGRGWNTIHLSGAGGISSGNEIRIIGMDATDLEVGSVNQPANLSAIWASVYVQLVAQDVSIYDQGDANDANEWSLSRSQTTDEQLIQKGLFSLRVRDTGFSQLFRINGGTTADSFAISGLRSNANYQINGGGGNDSLRSANANGHDNDLDEIFFPDRFEFNGGIGDDFIDLDDSFDQTGDGDTLYRVEYVGFDSLSLFKGSTKLVTFNTRRMNLVTSLDSEEIYLSGSFSLIGRTEYFTVSAGGGNDYITNYRYGGAGGLLQDYGFGGTIIGGTGTDTLAIDDTLSPSSAISYTFDPNRFSFNSVDLAYDGSLENLSLLGSNLNNVVRVNHKPANMTLSVNANGGNDTFTVGGGDIDSNGFSVTNTTLNGGNGADTMTFDDRLDTDPGSETESYLQTALAGVNKLSKGGLGVNYSLFESMTLDAANGTLGAQNVVDLLSFSSLITTVTVNGGSNAFNSVNIGSTSSGNIDSLSTAAFSINLSGGSDTVNLYNQASTFTNVYELKTNQLKRGLGQSPEFIVNHSGVETFNLRAGSNYDFFYPQGSAAGTGFIVYGNGGDDVFWIEDSWAALAGASIFVGGPGVDHMISATSSATAHTGTVTDTGVAVNGSPVQSYYECERLTANFGTGPATVNVKSLSIPTEMSTPGANSAVTIGDGNIQANIRATLNLNFQFGANSVITYDDRLDTGADSYFFNPNLTFYKTDGITAVATPLITGGGLYGNGTQTLLANNGNNTIICNTIVQNLQIFANGGNDQVNVAQGVVTVDTGLETGTNPNIGDNITVNSDFFTAGDVPATVRLLASDRIANVAIQPRGTLQIPTGVTMDVGGSIAVAGTIDLAGGSLLKRAAASGTTLAQFRSALMAGYAGGAWNGTSAAGAINSSLAAGSAAADAIGYGLGSEVAIQTIGGFNIAPSDVLIRHTFYGDADLNGVVDFDDFVHIDFGFNTGRTGWVNGDFNYGGDVEFDDFVLIDLAFNTQGA